MNAMTVSRREQAFITGSRLDSRITEVINRAAAERGPRRERWHKAVADAAFNWREDFGYKRLPIMDPRMVRREVCGMVATLIEGRLLRMLAPLMATVDSIDRSLQIVGIMASPSGRGRDQYAPKRDGLERISVR